MATHGNAVSASRLIIENRTESMTLTPLRAVSPSLASGFRRSCRKDGAGAPSASPSLTPHNQHPHQV